MNFSICLPYKSIEKPGKFYSLLFIRQILNRQSPSYVQCGVLSVWPPASVDEHSKKGGRRRKANKKEGLF
jgi:hypothetical protein